MIRLGENMNARDIDDDGYWIVDGTEIPLLGRMITVPDKLRGEIDLQEDEVLFLTDAVSCLRLCPKCGSKVRGIILNTEYFRLFPARCCNTIIWRSIGSEFQNHRDWIAQHE